MLLKGSRRDFRIRCRPDAIDMSVRAKVELFNLSRRPSHFLGWLSMFIVIRRYTPWRVMLQSVVMCDGVDYNDLLFSTLLALVMRTTERITLNLKDEDREIKEHIRELIATEGSRFYKRSETFVAIELLKVPLQEELTKLDQLKAASS